MLDLLVGLNCTELVALGTPSSFCSNLAIFFFFMLRQFFFLLFFIFCKLLFFLLQSEGEFAIKVDLLCYSRRLLVATHGRAL